MVGIFVHYRVVFETEGERRLVALPPVICDITLTRSRTYVQTDMHACTHTNMSLLTYKK
jgi:hypothetical protein